MNKYDYVRQSKQERYHHCHWPGCNEQVPPAKWGCQKHWYTLPLALRKKVWAAFIPGQEVDMTPSRGYVEVAREVQKWVVEYEKHWTGIDSLKVTND